MGIMITSSFRETKCLGSSIPNILVRGCKGIAQFPTDRIIQEIPFTEIPGRDSPGIEIARIDISGIGIPGMEDPEIEIPGREIPGCSS